jgi:hypothetical protein
MWQGDEWNIRLETNGPVGNLRNAGGVFPVLKDGKAVLKGLIMNVDHMPPTPAGNMFLLDMVLSTAN